MIESRYKIEYILPDDEIKKSSPFKVLWYLLLIPLVLLAVIAITYDFSFQNISRDTTILVEKAKVHIFNLGDQKNFKKPDLQTNTLVEKILIPKQKSIANTEQKVIIQKVVVKDAKDKKIIIELTEKQKEQQRKIQEQISQNKRLSQSLNSLSTELVKEKTKNDSLNFKLSEQEKDRTELEDQLNKILAESENNEVLIEDLVEDKTKELIIESKSNIDSIVKTIEENENTEKKKLETLSKNIDVLKTVNITSPIKNKDIQETPVSKPQTEIKTEQITIKMADKSSIQSLLNKKTEPVIAIKPEPSPVDTLPNEEGISETDKIIQAMSSIKSNTTIESEKNITESSVSSEKEKSDSDVVNEKTKSQDDKIVFAIGIDKKEDDTEAKAVILPKNNPVQTNVNSNEEITNNESNVVIKEDIESRAKTISPKIETEKPKPSSAVDDIIAAMQESQSSNSNPNDDNDNIDLELEKEIKQQLVEQGDLSIDN